MTLSCAEEGCSLTAETLSTITFVWGLLKLWSKVKKVYINYEWPQRQKTLFKLVLICQKLLSLKL